MESPNGETARAKECASFQCWQLLVPRSGELCWHRVTLGLAPQRMRWASTKTDWEMQVPVLDITTPIVCAHGISLGPPLPLHHGSASATTPSWHFLCFWGSVGSWVPFPELFCPVASILNNSGANKRTFECSADGTCHTEKINPQICSLMESSCRQMLSCEAASSQTDYFLAHIVYRRATPGISSFALQHFSKHS